METEIAVPENSWAQAKKNCVLHQCVKREVIQDEQGSDLTTASGVHFSIQRPSFLRTSYRQLHDYGCNIAVQLYLQFNLEVAVCFLVMGLVALVPAKDNYDRASLRNTCRTALAGDGADTLVPEACGFMGLPMRQTNITLLSFFDVEALGLFGLGACEEYSNASAVVLPMTPPDPFVHTPDAKFCSEANAATYCEVANVFIFILFMIRMRRMQRTMVKNADRALWTAADYAVMIDGVHAHRDGNELEKELYRDLRRLGFLSEAISHIEVARECKNEVELAQRIDAKQVEVEELSAKAARVAHGGGVKIREALAQARDEQEALRDELRGISGGLSTGHAFVVFQLEEDRNRLVNMFSRTLWERLMPECCGWGENRAELEFEAFDSGTVKLSAAPEPSDVYWENLAIDPSEARARRAKTYARVTVLLLLAMCAYGLIKWLKAKLTLNMAAGRGLALDLTSNLTAVVIDIELEGGLNATFAVNELLDIQLDTETAEVVTDAFSVLATTLIFIANIILRRDITNQTMTEGHATRTEYERSLFTKLAGAYVLNSVVLPILLGVATSVIMSDHPVTQDWYEDGGVVYQGVMLTLYLPLYELLKVVQIFPLIYRYVQAPFARSQQKLDSLWMPPQIYFGYLYAAAVMSVSLGMFYAPLYPPIYFLTAIAHLCAFAGTKFGICFWYKRPGALDDEIYEQMLSILKWVLLFHIVVKLLGLSAAMSGHAVSVETLRPWMIALGGWLVYMVVPLKYIKCLRAYDQLAKVGTGECDTGGIRYGEVQHQKKYEIERYVCPAARPEHSAKQIEALYRGRSSKHFALDKLKLEDIILKDSSLSKSSTPPLWKQPAGTTTMV